MTAGRSKVGGAGLSGPAGGGWGTTSGRLAFCGRPEQPGIATDDPQLIDWSAKVTTPDQRRLEDALEGLVDAGSRILHIGVGNSGLAARLAPCVQIVVGVTVSRAERAHAEALGIPNYRVHVVNKYGRHLCSTVDGHYDYIVDNNLASFVCCAYHLVWMFDNYLGCLKPRGRILTDRSGMSWTADGNSAWQLSYDDLEQIAGRFGLTSSAIGEHVVALERDRG
jgi:hypothetical protein